MENILVIRRSVFLASGYFQGFSERSTRELTRGILSEENFTFQPRDEMETDVNYKQLIPYCCIKCNNKVFSYTRGSAQGEARLHSKKSIGIGGHINDGDAIESLNPYFSGMYRELSEEVIINSPYTNDCIGLINDDSNPVGEVHLGIVQLINVENEDVKAKELSILDAKFVDIEEVYQHIDEYETWSQILIRHLYERRA